MNPANKGKQKPKLLKPGMVVLAAMFLWSAQHEPDAFDIGSVTAWALGAVTVGMLVYAALALASPVLHIMGSITGRALQAMQTRPEA